MRQLLSEEQAARAVAGPNTQQLIDQTGAIWVSGKAVTAEGYPRSALCFVTEERHWAVGGVDDAMMAPPDFELTIKVLKEEILVLCQRVEMLEQALRGGLCAVCGEVIGEEDWVLENGRLIHAEGCQGE